MDFQQQIQGDVKGEISWEYEHSRGKWVRYSEELSDQLTKTKNNCVETIIEESKLRLDVVALKQVNADTGFKINIRCCVRLSKDDDFVFWEVKKGRRYEPFAQAHQLALETGKKSGCLTIDIDGVSWKVDFEIMEMCANENSQKIRRTVSEADSSFSAQPVLPETRSRALIKRSINFEAMVSSKLDEMEEKEAEPKKKTKSVKESTKSRPKSTKENYNNGKRTMILKGRAPVDPECTEKLHTAHVLEEGDLVWDAMLNQTNIANNNNKYYILQLLEDDEAKRYSVWFRWGRVGYRGQMKLTPFGTDLEGAKECFTQKFYDKTLNEWAEKDGFESRGKYTLIHMDYHVPKNSDDRGDEEAEDESPDEVPESKLDQKIQALLALICNIQAMEEDVMHLEFDATRSPLGKLTEKQIGEGYKILGDIEKLIKKKDFNKEFVSLVNEYYTKIPHNFGFQQPPLIKTVESIRKEIDLLSVLEDIEIAVRNIGEARKKGEKIASVDKYYNNLHCNVRTLSPDSTDYKIVEKFMKTTHADTHMYTMKIMNMFQVDRHGEVERFRSDMGNRMLLWHGSRVSNFYGILSQGLRIAPPEAPSCGFMFGKGIYFADMASKSGNYCHPAKFKPGLLLLCEVALGEQRELFEADYDAAKLPGGLNSTLGTGKTRPNPEEYITLDDGVVVPCGNPIKNKSDQAKKSALLYNEFVVYSVDQVRIRYLVEVEFDL